MVCLQNGVENERRVLRHFTNTYGICVMCPASQLRPGVVQLHSAPVSGLLDIGRFPSGMDDRGRAIADAIATTPFQSVARTDIMRWKYRKLLMNLANAVEALAGPEGRFSALAREAQREGKEALAAAGIDVASSEEDRERRGDFIKIAGTSSGEWRGGSSWQSLARGAGSIEADFLNGEIVLEGGLHDVPTPVNALLQRLASRAAAEGAAPGSWSLEELSALAGLPAESLPREKADRRWPSVGVESGAHLVGRARPGGARRVHLDRVHGSLEGRRRRVTRGHWEAAVPAETQSGAAMLHSQRQHAIDGDIVHDPHAFGQQEHPSRPALVDRIMMPSVWRPAVSADGIASSSVSAARAKVKWARPPTR